MEQSYYHRGDTTKGTERNKHKGLYFQRLKEYAGDKFNKFAHIISTVMDVIFLDEDSPDRMDPPDISEDMQKDHQATTAAHYKTVYYGRDEYQIYDDHVKLKLLDVLMDPAAMHAIVLDRHYQWHNSFENMDSDTLRSKERDSDGVSKSVSGKFSRNTARLLRHSPRSEHITRDVKQNVPLEQIMLSNKRYLNSFDIHAGDVSYEVLNTRHGHRDWNHLGLYKRTRNGRDIHPKLITADILAIICLNNKLRWRLTAVIHPQADGSFPNTIGPTNIGLVGFYLKAESGHKIDMGPGFNSRYLIDASNIESNRVKEIFRNVVPSHGLSTVDLAGVISMGLLLPGSRVRDGGKAMIHFALDPIGNSKVAESTIKVHRMIWCFLDIKSGQGS